MENKNENQIILKAINDYEKALVLLDEYDHQTLKKPNGILDIYKINYDECRIIIDSYKDRFGNLFGIEKDNSFKSSINVIYQTAFGKDVYPSAEEKAANLLYFIVKNHSFIDGNKRIAASIFLYYLDRNNMLYINDKKIISDSSLVSLTILLAESKPEEKEIMIKLIMNYLNI